MTIDLPPPRTSQQRERDDRLKLLYAALERAANNGAPCPTNEDLSVSLGYSGPSKASDLMALLSALGFIEVERGSNLRIVTIVKTGKRTAGHIPRRLKCGGWTEDQDAILMDGMAEGLTFEAVSAILKRTKNSCIGRFQTIRASMGEQAI